MKYRARLAAVCSAALLALPPDGRAQTDPGPTLHDRVEALRQAANSSGPINAAVRDDVSSLGHAFGYQDTSGPRSAGELSNLQSLIAQNQYDQAIRLARRSIAQSQSPELKKLWEALLADLVKEQGARTAAVTEKVNALVKKVAEGALAAADSAALSPLADEIADLVEGGLYSESGLSANRLRNQVNGLQSFLEYWSQYLDARGAGRETEALQMLNNVRSSSAYRAIQRSLPPQALEERRTALTQELARRAAKRVADARELAAKGPAGCRRAMQILDEQRRESTDSDALGADLSRQLDLGRESLRGWQEVLDADAAGDLPSALNSFANFQNNFYSRSGWIKPETIEAMRVKLATASLDPNAPRATPDAVVRMIADRLEMARTASDLDAIEQGVLSLRNNLYRGNAPDTYGLTENLSAVKSLLASVEAGQYRAALPGFNVINNSSRNAGPWQKAINAIRQRTLARAVAAQWNLPALNDLPPDQTPLAAVTAAAEESFKKSDWPRLLELLQAERALDGGVGGFRYSDDTQPSAVEIAACRDYLEGQNLETAGQWVEAARTYQRVVRGLGRRLPRADATARLSALSKEHPEVAAALNR